MTEPAALPRTEPELDSTTRADQSDELATTTLLRAAIGPVNTDYYLSIFTRFDARDRVSPSWNTAAALSTLNWMLYRKLWNAALAYSGAALTVALLVFGIGKLAFHFSSEVQWVLAGLYALALVALPGFFGNALLFKQYRKSMGAALSAHHTLTEAAAMLLARAPTRQRLMGLGGINALAISALGALALWASSFSGLSPAFSVPTPPPTPVASGNVASGRAVEATAAAPAASAPAAVASAPQLAASAPQTIGSAAQTAASAPAPLATAAASAPLPAASSARSAATVASAPAAPASMHAASKAPAHTAANPASAPAPRSALTTSAPNAGRGSVQPTATTTTTTSKAAEKAEAAKLAPVSSAQNREPAAAGTASAPHKPAVAPKAAATGSAASTPSPAAPAKVKAAASPQAAVPETGAGKIGVPAGSFGINVGLFADDNNARNAFVKLSDAGLAAYTQETRGKKGKLTWVRVGPFDSMAQAEKAVDKIRALELDAEVFKQPAKP